MVDWLEKFAQSQSKNNKNMIKKASQIIVDKDKFPKAVNDDIVEYEDQRYKVVNSEFNDDEGDGILLEKCAELEGTPTEVDMGTSTDFADPVVEAPVAAQEYAHVDPKIQDEDPRDEEVVKFEEEAKVTEEAIAAENAIDGTSGATHPNRILERMFSTYKETITPVEEAPVEIEEIPVEEVPVDDVIEETPEDEICEDCDEVEEVDADIEEIKKLEDEFDVTSNRIAKRLGR